MKTKLLLSSLFILFLAMPLASAAQDFVKAGTTEVGGSISFSSQKYYTTGIFGNSNTLTTISFNPYIGFMSNGGFGF